MPHHKKEDQGDNASDKDSGNNNVEKSRIFDHWNLEVQDLVRV